MTAQAASPMPMRTPRSLDIELTARCNLRCTYCYFFNNPAVEYRDLRTAEWLRFFEECGRLGVMNLTLAGGEPFTRRDLRELLDGIVRNRMRYSVLSNGALIDDEIAAFIQGTGRCDYVQISLDGATPEAHDVFRGRGSFAGAVRGVRALQRKGVNVAVRLTLHRHNVDSLEATAQFLLEELGLPGFGTNAAGYLGNCLHSANEVLLTNAQRQQAMETLEGLEQRYPGRITASAGPLAEARMWRQMEVARGAGRPAFPNGGHLTGCGCPRDKIAVRSDGTLVPCSMLAHQSLGQINRDSLQDVWQTSPPLNDLRRRHAIPLSQFAFCAGCDYVPYCTGNCPGLAYTLTGQVDHPSPDACLRRFLAGGGRIPQDPRPPG